MSAHATAAPPAAPDDPPRGRRRPSAVPAAGAALALAVLLGGCGLRIETPTPTEPVPDARELVRETAVLDARTVSELVSEVTPTVKDADVLALLAEVDDFATEHVDALGGVYDSGLPSGLGSTDDQPRPAVTTTAPRTDDEAAESSSEDTGSASATTEPATTDDVVTALVEASQRTGASADATQDGELARLLASVATSEDLSARRLAAATGSEAADVLVTAVPVVDEAPSGVGAADLATLVASEDSAGYAYEVRAAQTDGKVRTRAVERAAQHRARAQAWALAAGTGGTDQDPRRVAYVLPDDDVRALAQLLETDLAVSYASLVATATPQSRATSVGLLEDAWSAAVSWGAAPSAFPGMPEQAEG
ncbi:DUF4439 domain-containing protein [Cellulosimicrobium arenosum]|uniref:DUF4439 domain-containing protein n=1 Tax=Cellulosimicrobium arenosum TaxID=2708133 RepID=A0A927GAM4_9MICO|nr:DUF4439 domain-containing protein [Cellulosimicrobium arenosum]MBD8079272.1 DUF4439 domain-containing protein [Cellulosimicrobium arenosum]